MKVIQTLADVQSLNDERLPSFYVEEIYNQFLWTYESVAKEEAIDDFSLGLESCIYHLEKEDDWFFLEGLTKDIEYIDRE